MPQAVVDGHQETLEGGAESARMILRAGGRLGMGGDYGFDESVNRMVAVHSVVGAAAIYRTIADLKALGAEGILVTRIERLMP